jgi:hypothetical protein
MLCKFALFLESLLHLYLSFLKNLHEIINSFKFFYLPAFYFLIVRPTPQNKIRAFLMLQKNP